MPKKKRIRRLTIQRELETGESHRTARLFILGRAHRTSAPKRREVPAAKSRPLPNSPCRVEESLLDEPANEEARPLEYSVNAVAYLVNVLHADKRLRKSKLFDRLLALVAFWSLPPERRDRARAHDAAIDASYFGYVGRALWHIDPSVDPQLRRELARLAEHPEAIVGNQFLFYVAGTLASKGFAVEFVPEKGKTSAKTPDLCVRKDNREVWVEANAKQPKREIDTPEKLWQLLRDIVDEKKQKFTDPGYSPGMIAADISTADVLNRPGAPRRHLKLLRDLCRPLPGVRPSARWEPEENGFVYPLFADVDWRTRPENQNNVFAFAAEEFRGIDRGKYHVSQCMIGLTRVVWRGDGALSFPKAHQLLVTKSGERSALVELSRHVYVIDAP